MAPPFLELGTIGTHDLDQYDHHLFNYLEPQSSFSSTTSSLSSPIFLSPPHQVQPPISDHRYYREPQNFQFQLLEADHHIVSYGGSLCDHDQGRGNESVVNFSVDDHSKSGAKDQQRIHENRSTTSHGENVSVKWMSSKMRIMKKMNSPDHTATAARVNNFEFEEQQIKVHPSSSPPPPSGITESSNNAAPIRVCSDCNTTKTPLWRSGPRGPKSLCNACGIRQRKARRAMAAAAAAAAAANGGTAESVAAPSVIKTSTTKVKIKDNKTIPFKKRCHKLTSTTTSPSPRAKSSSSSSSKTTTKLHFEDFSISTMNQNNSGTPPPPPSAATAAFQRAFPQDEKEAAILLMALSCGLVQG